MIRISSAAVILLLISCTYINTPSEVTTYFWKAMEQNDLETAKKYALPGSMDKSTLTDDTEVKLISVSEKVDIENSTAKVQTEISMTREGETSIYRFDTILVKLDKEWKVDYKQTVNSLMMSSVREFGREFKQLGKEMGKAIGEAMKEMGKAMEEVFKGEGDTANGKGKDSEK